MLEKMKVNLNVINDDVQATLTCIREDYEAFDDATDKCPLSSDEKAKIVDVFLEKLTPEEKDEVYSIAYSSMGWVKSDE